MEYLVLRNGVAKANDYDSREKGSGIYMNNAKLELFHVRLTNNMAFAPIYNSTGGAIYGTESRLRIFGSELDHNRADLLSTIHIEENALPTMITASAIHHNINNYNYSGHLSSTNEMVVTNSTIAENQRGDTQIQGGNTVWIQNSTVITKGAQGVAREVNDLKLYYNVLMNLPIEENGEVQRADLCRPASGTVQSLGGNFFSDSSCQPGPEDQVITPQEMRLGPLANYGGFSPTFALTPGSPAIDFGSENCMFWGEPAGKDAFTGDFELLPLVFDQRRFQRDDGHCDVGSFELQPGENPVMFLHLPIIRKN